MPFGMCVILILVLQLSTSQGFQFKLPQGNERPFFQPSQAQKSVFQGRLLQQLMLSDDTCLQCLVLNEPMVRKKLENQTFYQDDELSDGVQVTDDMFYSHCTFENETQCCLFDIYGNLQNNLDSDVCQFGSCSHQAFYFNSSQLSTQYFYCNPNVAESGLFPMIPFSSQKVDQVCGNPMIILHEAQQTAKAIKIYYDPANDGNITIETPNNDTQTNDTSNNNDTNNGNSTNNDTTTDNNTDTNVDNNNNNTDSGNDTNTVSNETNDQNSTDNNTDNNPDNNIDSNNQTDNQTNDQDSEGSNNSSNDSSDNGTLNDTGLNDGGQVVNNDTILNSQGGLRRLEEKGTNNTNNNQSLISEIDIKLCQYQVQVHQQVFDALGANSAKIKLSLTDDSQVLYFINLNTSTIGVIHSDSSIYDMKEGDLIQFFGVFDISQTIALYVEYNIYTLAPLSDDSKGLSPIIIVVIVISVVAGICIVALAIFLIIRRISKRNMMIKMNIEEQLQKEQKNIHAEQNRIASDIEQTRNMPKLSSRLVSGAMMQQIEKSQSKMNLVTENKAYNLTLEDISKRSLSHSQNNTIMGGDRRRSQDFIQGELIKSGSQVILDQYQRQFFEPEVDLPIKKTQTIKSKFDLDNNDTDQDPDYEKKSSTGAGTGSGGQKSLGGKNLNKGENSGISGDYDTNKQGNRIITDDEQHDFEDRQDKFLESMKKDINPDDSLGQLRENLSSTKPRPQTAKVKNEDENVFKRRVGGGYKSALRQRPNPNHSITYDRDLTGGMDMQHGDKNPKAKNPRNLSRGYTTDNAELTKQIRTIGNIDSPSNNQKFDDESNTEDPHELFKKKLQIFQSESKFEDYDYMYEDESSFNQNDVQRQYDDDEIKSGFHSDLKEQFKQVKKTNGILKNGNGQTSNILSRQPVANQSEKGRKLSEREEYLRRYDDYYQDGNNMIFQTGTFNNEEDDDDNFSKHSMLTVNLPNDKKNNSQYFSQQQR